jgi:hypothetical protein
LHGTDANDQLLFGDDPSISLTRRNQACTQCHPALASGDALSAYTHHESSSEGSLCYNCHMPFQAYSLLKRVRSHRISRPDVKVTATTGIPNACNQCHVDRTLAWTDEKMAAWYGTSASELGEAARGVASIPHDLLSGHALQRALAAEQLGAPANFQLAGPEWRARLLIEALDDEYAAVRFLAGEALRKLPEFTEFEFDYSDVPKSREVQVREARRRWSASATPEARLRLRALLGGQSGDDVDELIELLKARQNPAPIDILE